MRRLIIFLMAINSYLVAQELSFITYLDNKWQIVVCKNKECQVIKTKQEPRTYDYDFKNRQVVYIASDESVRLVYNNQEKIIVKPKKDKYTEPLFINDAKEIMLVRLINGNSKDTEIISIDLSGKNQKSLHYQHSTSLEPFSIDGKKIYYANVSCVNGCGHIIQEIWQKDNLYGIANQITLLNSLSHQPIIDEEGKSVYFSSNKMGNFHIYKTIFSNGKTIQITKGDVTDSFPNISNGVLYFVRRKEADTKIMRLKDGELEKLEFDKKYRKIRNLKVKR